MEIVVFVFVYLAVGLGVTFLVGLSDDLQDGALFVGMVWPIAVPFLIVAIMFMTVENWADNIRCNRDRRP